MSIFERRPALRWAVPVAAVAVVAGVVEWPSAAQADNLPARSAEQLLVDVQQAKVDGLSGTVSETTDLGLPTLPAGLGGGSSDTSLQSLVSGTHTARVWATGDQSRVSVQSGAQETTVVHNGTNVWEWQSASQTATHYVLPRTSAQKTSTTKIPATKDMPATPQAAAQQLVAELSKTSTITTAAHQTVAGRPAYELVLTPKTSASRVQSVRIAIDGTSHVPTRVQVFSTKTGAAAIDFGFTSVTFAKPAASVFAFTPAKGVTVTTKDLSKQARPAKPSTTQHQQSGTEKVVGTGWAQVVTGKLDLTAMAAAQKKAAASNPSQAKASADQASQLLNLLPTASGSWGTGHVLDGTLFSVVITNDGRYAIGAVSPTTLYAALPAK